MKRVFGLVVATMFALALTAVPAGAQVADTTITVDVTKEVINAPQSDAQFVIKLTCQDNDDVESDSETVLWHSPGSSPWHLDPADGEFTLSVTDNWDDDVWCVVTETLTGGATSTTITCVDDSYATCDGAYLYIDEEDLGLEVTYGEFEVVNDFTPLPTPTTVAPAPVAPAAPVAVAPAPVVVSPRFTG